MSYSKSNLKIALTEIAATLSNVFVLRSCSFESCSVFVRAAAAFLMLSSTSAQSRAGGDATGQTRDSFEGAHAQNVPPHSKQPEKERELAISFPHLIAI